MGCGPHFTWVQAGVLGKKTHEAGMENSTCTRVLPWAAAQGTEGRHCIQFPARGRHFRWGSSGCKKKDKFILNFLGSKITADGDCSHEIKTRLLLGRKSMANLGSILKSRVITWPTKVHLVKVMVFPVVMFGCESWTIKKAEH